MTRQRTLSHWTLFVIVFVSGHLVWLLSRLVWMESVTVTLLGTGVLAVVVSYLLVGRHAPTYLPRTRRIG